MVSRSHSDGEKQRLHELASAVFDGSAAESEREELTELLRSNPAARDEYLLLVDLHAVLSTEPAVAPAANKTTVVEPARTDLRPRFRTWQPVAVAVGLAACLMIAVLLSRSEEAGNVPVPFATIAQGTDAVWRTDLVSVGDRIGAQTLELSRGVVRLEFDSGVEVTLEGPADFTLVDASKTVLKSGILTATVPKGAEGFTVDTPSAQVIDLGTSFGIDIDADGGSNVIVFDGEVEVAPRSTLEKRLLTEGESIRIGNDERFQDIGFNAKPFEKLWPTASGIAGSTDSIRFVPPWPKQIRLVQSDDHIFVRPEGGRVRLQAELKVNVSEPGDYDNSDNLTPVTLPSRRSVRSYILHFSTESTLGPRRARRVTGSITFARPVIGIIVSHEELAASSRRFGRRGAGEANQRRELNLTGDEFGDRISLSEDRRTVTLDLIAPGRSSDLIRVIVEDTRLGLRSQRIGGF